MPVRVPVTAVIIEHLELVDFRNYVDGVVRAALRHHGGHRRQRSGQDQPAEALAYLATLRVSGGADRGLSAPARSGGHPCDEVARTTGARLLIEAELAAVGRNRVQVNRQRLPGSATCSARCGSRCSRPTT